MYAITLANGTKLENLELNCNNYISPNLLDDSIFDGGLSRVEIFDGEKTEVHEDMMLVQNTTYGDGKSWFVLAEKSPEQKKEEAYQAEIAGLKAQLGVVEDVVDTMLIEQLMERGIISNV